MINPQLRPSQQERDDVAALLGLAFAEGRLDLREFEERITAAFAARTAADLGRLLVDLPPPQPARRR